MEAGRASDNDSAKVHAAILGYIIAAMIGSIVFILIGYVIFVLGTKPDAVVRLQLWMAAPWTYRVPHWTFLGAAIGLGLRYLSTNKD
jgi:hypothetical protein